MTKEKKDYFLARYMVGRYRLGYEYFALYLAGTLFETIINKKLIDDQGYAESSLENLKLEERIDLFDVEIYKSDNLFATFSPVSLPPNKSRKAVPKEKTHLAQLRDCLHNFRLLRNKVMHGKLNEISQKWDNTKNDIILYVWKELASDSFALAYKEWEKHDRKGRIVDILFEHTADYMVRSIDEIEVRQRDKAIGFQVSALKIYRHDFDNLYELRRKLIPFKNYLDHWLEKNANYLQTDILTTIDTTSAYIWMPLVSKEKKENHQAGIYDCSISILATPLDLRVYLDFGGHAKEARKHFYNFIDGCPEYSYFISKAKERLCFEVFDIDWYSSIFNRRTFNDWLGNTEKKDRSLIDAHKKLTKEQSTIIKNPVTWNRNLHGYIFTKYDLNENSYIDFKMIEPEIKDVIDLFNAFKRYEQRIGNIK